MTVFNAEQSQAITNNHNVIPLNEACIYGVDYLEIQSLVNSMDLFNLQDEQVKLVRLFVKKLHTNLKERESYKTEIVAGLLRTKDDFTFVSFVQALAEGLWC